MISLRENQSKIWLKILSGNGNPIDGTDERWKLPKGSEKGSIRRLPEYASRFSSGEWTQDLTKPNSTWLVYDPNPFYHPNSDQVIFIAQLHNTPAFEIPGMIWVNKVSLIREATSLDLKRYGIHKAFHQHI